MKKYPVILLSSLLLSTPISAATVDLPTLMGRDATIRPYLKDLVSASSVREKSHVLASIESPTSFQQLDFKELTPQVFGGNAWVPSSRDFRDGNLQELFRPYRSHLSSSEGDMIFSANAFYDAGRRLYELNENYTYLELAASIGHAEAQYRMFFIHFRGNKLEAAKNSLFCSAAQGNSDALLTLSSVYQGYWGPMVERNIEMARALCQEAANLGNEEAIVKIRVGTLTGGLFNSERNYQQGIREAKALADSGNRHAREFIESIKRSSGDALQEGNDFITYEDLAFLRTFLGWKDVDDE